MRVSILHSSSLVTSSPRSLLNVMKLPRWCTLPVTSGDLWKRPFWFIILTVVTPTD